MSALIDCHPGHELQVTEGAFGRGYVDCECGYTRVLGSKPAANRMALIHHHDVGGCNCPPHVVAHERHPTDPRSERKPAPVAVTSDGTAVPAPSNNPFQANRDQQ